MIKKLLRTFVLLLAVLAVSVSVNAQSDADVNGDGEVTIADINAIVEMILSGTESSVADVNGDGEVTVADVNAVIDSILGGSSVTPPGPGGIEGFSEETLALLRDNGMNIYEGNEPPVISGVYAMEPVNKIVSIGWGDWEDAEKILKMIFNFKGQNGGKILFAGGSYKFDYETEEEYAEGDNEFMLVNINGQGNKFTISYTIGADDEDDMPGLLLGGAVISGEKANNGIKNLQVASILYPIPMLGLNETILDIYVDGDGMSYPSEWPEWPEEEWVKSTDAVNIKTLMTSKAMKLLKSVSEGTTRIE